MNLESEVIPIRELTDEQLLQMLNLMQKYYLNVTRDQFIKDIKEKELVIILHNNKDIHGFSTWMLFPHVFADRQVNVIFSGDTIIEPTFWNSLELPLAWGRLMLSVKNEYPQELYWLLISKGYKTYRFLPVFFREYYPSYDKETPPFYKALIRSLAQRKFGQKFDPESGTIKASTEAQYIRPGIADITEARRRYRHIGFFEKANPGYTKGDELVCITLCHEDNLCPFILRRLRRYK